MLQTHVPVHMTLSYFTRPFLTVHTNRMYVCVFVLIHFQERFLIDEFSMKTLSVLVWTKGLNASKGMRFNRKHIRMDGTRISLFSCLGCSSRWIYGNGLLLIFLIVSATPAFLRTVVLMEHPHCLSKDDDSNIPVHEEGEKCETKQQQKQTIIFLGMVNIQLLNIWR